MSRGVAYHGCGGSTGSSCNYDFRRNSDTGNDGRPASLHTFDFITDVQLVLTNSLKADNPITIDFAGAAVGTVNVTANAPIVLTGAITNPDGATAISSTAGSITASKTSKVVTQKLTLTATAGIGTPTAPVNAAMTGGQDLIATDTSTLGVHLALNSGARLIQVRAGTASGWGASRSPRPTT